MARGKLHVHVATYSDLCVHGTHVTGVMGTKWNASSRHVTLCYMYMYMDVLHGVQSQLSGAS